MEQERGTPFHIEGRRAGESSSCVHRPLYPRRGDGRLNKMGMSQQRPRSRCLSDLRSCLGLDQAGWSSDEGFHREGKLG